MSPSRNDPQKVVTAFVERLTDALCYTAKWLKSSLVAARIGKCHQRASSSPGDPTAFATPVDKYATRLLAQALKRNSLKSCRKSVSTSNPVKSYNHHRYVMIDEIEYELDATKVTASVNPCSPGTRLFASGRSLTPSVAPPRARGALRSCQRIGGRPAYRSGRRAVSLRVAKTGRLRPHIGHIPPSLRVIVMRQESWLM